MGVSAAVAAVALVAGANETRKGAKAQRKSSRVAERKANIQSARERRETIRQARIRRADILTGAANTGAAGSSSEAGSIGSLQGQLGEKLGTSFKMQDLSQEQGSANRSAIQASSNAAMFGTVATIATGFVAPKAPKTP